MTQLTQPPNKDTSAVSTDVKPTNTSNNNNQQPVHIAQNAYIIPQYKAVGDSNITDALINEFKQRIQQYVAKNPQYVTQQYIIDLQSNVDGLVYKYLKARKYNVNAAVDMFIQAIEYRYNNHVDNTMHTANTTVPLYLHTEVATYHGVSKCGRPLYIQQQGAAVMSDLLSKFTNEQRIDAARYVAEYLRMICFPLASMIADKRIDSLIAIVDMSGFGFSHMKPQQFKYVNTVSTVDQLLYPEKAYKVFMLNVPKVFSAVWSVVKHWLDDGLKQKFTIVPHSGLNEMSEFIDLDQLPRDIGGKCTQCQNCMTDHRFQQTLLQASQYGVQFDTDNTTDNSVDKVLTA